ncbi:sugar phosphate isomerase/epimerase family protein [Flavobacteriaceae bacterium 14752]|uniref:sugar phosphate isomerase/epimerase family protein n=1 Tax=Mesohalobacter salilacus TaxID=2491711 RepID=UPI000F62FF80|nr:sugar phosphate isomerase/epimerase [Flavobacteriaceae bacterium 14752]
MKSIFLKLTISCFLVFTISCKNEAKKPSENETKSATKTENKVPFFKLSLAQWSLHRTFNDDNVDPFRFAKIAKDMGFEGLEYVNHIYDNQIDDLGFDAVIDSLNTLSQKHSMQNVLIMVDGEGDLASPNIDERNQAVENHKKWVDAAQKLGCHSIRVNTFGTNDPKEWLPSVVDGLKKLSTYAATKNINVLCENHGWLSSDAPLLIEAIDKVNMDNCGTLPDFGNWCVKRKDGEQWGECVEEYPDKYQGIELLLTEAKAVSAKSYDFDEKGNETTLDYPRILKLVKDSGYTGYIGVEYEGDRLPEKEGVLATKNLLLKSAKSIN